MSNNPESSSLTDEEAAVAFFKDALTHRIQEKPVTLEAIYECRAKLQDGTVVQIAGEPFTVGAAVYLKKGGIVSPTPPTGRGEMVHRIGYALSPTEVIIQHTTLVENG